MTVWLPSWCKHESACPDVFSKRVRLLVHSTLLLLLLISLSSAAQASNMLIENADIFDADIDTGTVKIIFDLSWEYSFRDAINWDAAWVFAKYTLDGGTTWKHATLKSAGLNPTDFSSGLKQSGSNISKLNIQVTSDLKGALIYPAGISSGTVDFHGVTFIWDYNADGVSFDDFVDTNTKVEVYALEMVYIPAGWFKMGDAAGASAMSNKSFARGRATTTTTGYFNPIDVTSDGSLAFGYGSSSTYNIVWGSSDLILTSTWGITAYKMLLGTLPFYLMKYEITEGEWIAFFNTLTSTQKTLHDITGNHATYGGKNTDSSSYRNTVSWDGTNPATTARPARACSFLSFMDVTAFADWAALRLPSEWEFEKAARGGGQTALLYEYAWGSTGIKATTLALSGTEDGTETVTTTHTTGGAHYGEVTITGGDGGQGPLRVGIFAKSSSSRAEAGAGYYGNMELSGNLWELVVKHYSGTTINSNSTPYGYDVAHGDGSLTTSGYANASWPGYISGSGVCESLYAGRRGGSWKSIEARLHVSDRYSMYSAESTETRINTFGGRCARTAE